MSIDDGKGKMKLINEEIRATKHRVLIIIPGNIEFRGIQIFFLNVLKYFPQKEILVDLYFAGFDKNKELLERFIRYKCGVYIGKLNLEIKENRKQYKNDLDCLMTKNKYSCIYVNSGMPWFNLIALEEAYKNGITKRISHSHSAHIPSKNIIKKVYKKAIQLRSNYLATDFLACSQSAGDWMFGVTKMKSAGKIMYNGIDVDQYTFSDKVRCDYRKKYNVIDKHVILHVGAFNSAKNQSFLIDVFECVKKKDYKATLFLIGDGPKENSIRNKVIQKGLIDDVIFIGETSKISDYMQMADLFVLPSFYEGFGIVNVEAQASGLKCLVSDVVPQLADVTGLVTFLSLGAGIECWANCIIDLLRPYKRIDTTKKILESGFNSKTTAQKLQETLEE